MKNKEFEDFVKRFLTDERKRELEKVFYDRAYLLACLNEISALKDTFGDYQKIITRADQINNISARKKHVKDVLSKYESLGNKIKIDDLIKNTEATGNGLVNNNIDDPEILDDQEFLRDLYLKKNLEPLVIFKNTIYKLNLFLSTLSGAPVLDEYVRRLQWGGDKKILEDELLFLYGRGRVQIKQDYIIIIDHDPERFIIGLIARWEKTKYIPVILPKAKGINERIMNLFQSPRGPFKPGELNKARIEKDAALNDIEALFLFMKI